MKLSGKFFWITLLAGFSLVVLFFVGRYLLYSQIKHTIEEELAALKDQEILVTYDHMDIDPWAGKLEFIGLSVKVRKDSVNQKNGLDAAVPYVLVKGIELIPFLRNRTLSVHTISVQRALVSYARGTTLLEHDSTRRRVRLRNISVQHVDVPSIDMYVRDTLVADTLAHVLANVEMKDLFLHKQLDSMTWQRGVIKVSALAMHAYKEHYGMSVKSVRFDIGERTIDIDSFRVKPVLNKNAFMQAKGREATYVDGVIPSIRLQGVEWFSYPKPMVDIDKVTLMMTMRLYRDKRLPFIQNDERKLPSHMLHELGFQLNIDSLLIKDSYLSYEEHPEEGDSTGIVYFDKVYATITKVHNNPKLKEEITMSTYARFMGNGTLNAHFTFPYDTMKPYRVSGSLENMRMPELNRMLGAAAKARIESGTMNRLDFRFTYTNTKSTGEVELNYENLKIQTLRENRKNQQAVSHLKTLLLNTFIIKKDMTEDMADDKRKGTIDYERDKRRSVFNYWWKSIFAGVKSAYNLDDLPLGIMGEKKEKEEKKSKVKDIFSKIF
jgi:hypothetical protein